MPIILPFRPRPISAALSGSEWLAQTLPIESLTITPDAMPGHYIARAVILDLQPSQIVAAIVATMDRVKAQHPYAFRTGWRASSDGLAIYFES